MNELIIDIPNMQSIHCQTRVNNVVKEIEGAIIQNLESGKLTVTVTSDSVKEAIVAAIEQAGYIIDGKVENKGNFSCNTGCCKS